MTTTEIPTLHEDERAVVRAYAVKGWSVDCIVAVMMVAKLAPYARFAPAAEYFAYAERMRAEVAAIAEAAP